MYDLRAEPPWNNLHNKIMPATFASEGKLFTKQVLLEGDIFLQNSYY